MNKLTPVKAHRARCLDCQGHRPSLVRNCQELECPSFPYRMGKNPRRKGIGNSKGVSSANATTQVATFGEKVA